MSRNGSGTYTLPAGNPVVTGTTIEASWANTTLGDIATTLTDSLSRSGQGGMTAALRLADGTQGAPGLGFANETGSGFYRAGTGEVWAVVQGAQTMNLDASGVTVPADKATSIEGTFVFNETGADKDARFEGDNDANLLFIDASTDRVGVGTNAPTAKLNVEGSVIINDAGADVDVRIEGDTDANLVFVDASTDRVGVGTATPGTKLDVAVSRASGANASSVTLSDNVTGSQSAGFGTRIVGSSNAGSAVSAVAFEASGDGTNNQTQIAFYTQQNLAGGLARRATIDYLGNVGIGTNTPTAKLNVEGSVTVNDAGADVDVRIEGDTDANLVFVDASTDRVGIGTNTPSEKLTVNGGVQATSFNSGQLAGMRNRIINGAMGIDQRNAGTAQTITAAAALAYTVDRWYAYCTGANVTGQRVSGTAPNQFNYRFTGAASVTKIGFAQRIEAANSQDLAGTTATLSVDLANSVLTTVTWTAWYANSADTFGTLASPTRTQIATGTFTVSSTLARYNTQISIPSAATTGIEIEFSVAAQTSGTWTIGRTQLENGNVVTPFEHRPIGAELALCQRYYVKTYDINQPPANATTNGVLGSITTSGGLAYASFVFPVSMRVAPTIVTLYNSITGATGTWRDGGATDRAVNAVAAGASSILINCTTAAASSAISGHAVAIAEL